MEQQQQHTTSAAPAAAPTSAYGRPVQPVRPLYAPAESFHEPGEPAESTERKIARSRAALLKYFDRCNLNEGVPDTEPALVFWSGPGKAPFINPAASAVIINGIAELTDIINRKDESFWTRFGKVRDHVVKENVAAYSMPGGKVVIDALRDALATTLFLESAYKVVGYAFVFRRTGASSPFHQDLITGWNVYQMLDPAPDVPGGLRLLLNFKSGRLLSFRRNNQEIPLPADFASAGAVAMNGVAAGAGKKGDISHGRINADGEGGAEMTVRIDIRITGRAGPGCTPAPMTATQPYQLFHQPATRVYSDRPTGRPRAPAVELIAAPAEDDNAGAGNSSERPDHCSRCVELLSPRRADWRKLARGLGTFWVCGRCLLEVERLCAGEEVLGSSDPVLWRCGQRRCSCNAPPINSVLSGVRKKESRGKKGKLFVRGGGS